MPSRDVNAATPLAEASWRRDKICYFMAFQNSTDSYLILSNISLNTCSMNHINSL